MKLSIITINRNNAEGLRKTMQSVFSQTYCDFEYIVIDGASIDGSIDIINEYAIRSLNYNLLSVTLNWLSEKDTGIYDAMNKGLRISHGEYILMLNSGDFLLDEHVLECIIPELDGTDIIQGNNIEDRDGKIFRNRGYGKSDIDMSDIIKGYFLHQASFCRRELFDKYGYFDESYKMGADTKFFMNCLGVHNATFKYIDIDITNYDVTGISAEKSGHWAECREQELARLLSELFVQRVTSFVFENDKKIRLYDFLHQHSWIWCLVMAVTRIANLFYKKPTDIIIENV